MIAVGGLLRAPRVWLAGAAAAAGAGELCKARDNKESRPGEGKKGVRQESKRIPEESKAYKNDCSWGDMVVEAGAVGV